jgi:ABC-2 type transport system ATP-binding protein
MSDPQLAVEATGLVKSYGSTRVLDRLDLAVGRGQVFALLGPNGAGKTTAVRVLATLTTADQGTALVAGHDVVTGRHEVRRRISLTGQYAALDEAQTGAENLRMMGRLLGLSGAEARARAGHLLRQLDLTEVAGRRVATYSGGLRRRLDLAAGLVARPEVMFLDEPTTGLDPRSRQAMWQVVADLAESGVTVFLTTQYLDEADRLAGRIAVIDAGRLVAQGTAAELKAQVAGRRLVLRLVDAASYESVRAALGARAVHTDRSAMTVGVPTDGGAVQVRRLLDEVDPHCTRIERFDLREASLDDVFFALTGKAARTADDVESETADV